MDRAISSEQAAQNLGVQQPDPSFLQFLLQALRQGSTQPDAPLNPTPVQSGKIIRPDDNDPDIHFDPGIKGELIRKLRSKTITAGTRG